MYIFVTCTYRYMYMYIYSVHDIFCIESNNSGLTSTSDFSMTETSQLRTSMPTTA